MNKHNNSFIFYTPLLCAVFMALGIWLGNSIPKFGSRQTEGQDKLNEVLKLIDRAYVDDIDTDSLLEALMPELLSSLDPHSVYIPARDLQSVNEELDGSFSGIGIVFNLMTDTIVVDEVVSGGPSERVGLLPGDRIITVDDSICAGKGFVNSDVTKLLRGPAGTDVRLGILRPGAGDDLLPYTVTRGTVPVTTLDASYMITDNTGYIRINRFGSPTFNEFLTAAADLKFKGADSYIIDLRGNTGGYMEIANMMANEFLKADDPIVSMKGRLSDSSESYGANGRGSFADAKVTVLLDEYSASASEIFAGAIQDNDRGLVIGRRSFGKGLVQRQYPLADSSAVRLTIARYYTPSGRCIQRSYTLGDAASYQRDMIDRFTAGELFSVDSIRQNTDLIYHTVGGRTVYGGGGIMPDIFVPVDTVGYSKYYNKVVNAGLLQKYSFAYTDANRAVLNEAESVQDLLDILPHDSAIIADFVAYATREAKIPAQWYYINISRDLIVMYLKALIARDIFGTAAYYEVVNAYDPTVQRAIDEIEQGHADAPVTVGLNAAGD